ncbi:MAG: diacylglycerol kinase, partial [Pseudomonadales bacterium]|nr:diacylglycerol kinase [Pseudomonadales bacterium]
MTDNDPTFDKKKYTGFRHLLYAIRWSLQGLVAAFRHEAAFRQELAIIALLLPLGVWIAQTLFEFAILLGACLFVLAAELFNSSLEAAVDRISEE